MKSLPPIFCPALLLLLTVALACSLKAAEEADYPALPRDLYRSGQSVLDAFAPISAKLSNSIVELNVNEDAVALGAVVDAKGLVLTKASELKKGKLTCWLPSGKEVEARLLATDDDNDVALVRIGSGGLNPIQWSTNQPAEGQWAVTPGLADTPLAVGIISALAHKIRPARAFIGVRWKGDSSQPMVSGLMHGFGAEKAGVKPGDIILSVEGSTITNQMQVSEILSDFREGQTVRIRFRRAQEEYDASIPLMTLKPGQDGFEELIDEHEGRLNGVVSQRTQGFDEALEHDTVLKPWQCGGPLVDLDGKVIGLNIARASRFATYALPSSLARRLLEKLRAKSEIPQTVNIKLEPHDR